MACPDDHTVTFTCTLSSTDVQWIVTPPPSSGFGEASGIASSDLRNLSIGVSGFMFQAAFTELSGGMATSTLTTVTDVALLDGTMVMCAVVCGMVEGSLPITTASECYQVAWV